MSRSRRRASPRAAKRISTRGRSLSPNHLEGPMKNRMHVAFVIASASMIALACQRDQTIVGPSLRGSPRATREATLDGPKAVVVNPNANGNGVATTIQEAIDRVASGGQVLVKAGTYTEALIITKGLTLRPIGEGEGQVIIAP